MTYVRRKIDLTFKLGTGKTFVESGSDTVTVRGHRVQAYVDKVTGPGMGAAQIRIYGLTPSLMNQLSALNNSATAILNNSVTLMAGDDASGMAIVFAGQIRVSEQCLNTAPDTSLLVVAQSGALEAVQIAPPLSYPGSADVAVVMQNIAQVMGKKFENNGVSVQLATPYFPGCSWEQARRCAEHAGIEWVLDGDTLAIWPSSGSRGGRIPLVSSDTGMIGYPNYSTDVYGLEIQTVFNPLLSIGGQVQVKSDLGVACGTWRIFNIRHELDSETPGGQWSTRFSAAL